uniref:Na+:solute symporter n=1 Tax=Roseihalotalea indica TaxID=2867963 RepID=A0AA49GMW2_9BACT|nr:Na+:solute symporter [Tunicatimonas sp. TK19036]
MKPLDIWALILFSLVVFLIGLSFLKSGKDIKSFFAAGGAVPWWINGLSLFMSFFSAGTFVVWGSIAYSEGWVSVMIQWTMAIAGLLIGFFIAPRWRKTGAVTAAEYISRRLGNQTQKIYTYLFLLIAMFTTGAFLYPVAKIVQVSTGFPLVPCILILGGAITLYTAAGGLWAVIVTDVLQFIVLTAAVIIVIPLSFQAVNGVGKFVQEAPEDFFRLFSEQYSPGFMIAFGLYNLVFIGGNWAYVQRYTSVSRPREAKKVGWLFGSLYLISPIVWMLPPMIYRVLNPGLEGFSDEGAYLMMCKAVLPGGMLGLMLGGMVFATSSSVNTTLNISAGVFTNDLYRTFFPNSTDQNNMLVARLSTLVFGALTIVVALLVPQLGGIVEVVLTVAALTGGALYLPPIWSLFSPRQTGASILTATLVSLAINVLFKFWGDALLGFTLSRAAEMALGVGIPLLVLAAFEVYFTIRKQTDIRFQTVFHRSNSDEPSKETEDEESQANLHGMRVIAFGILAVATLIIGLGLLADFGQMLVTTIGLVVLILGAALLIRTNRIKKLQSDKSTLYDSRKVH